MSQLLQSLLDQAKQNLHAKVNDPAWVDLMMGKLSDLINQSELPNDLKTASLTTVQVILGNKSKISNLSAEGLTLFIQHLATGNSTKAIDVYIMANSDPGVLIALMNSTTDGVLKAKQKLDQMHKDSLQLLKEVGVAGARALLPFLLSLL